MAKIKNNHTAAITGPWFTGFPLGIELAPGETEVPDDYVAPCLANPSIAAWVEGGLLEISEAPKTKLRGKAKAESIAVAVAVEAPKSEDPTS